MKLWNVCAGLLVFGIACGADEPKNDAGTGALQLALVGYDREGNQYRLRNGEFQIQGYSEIGDDSFGGSAGYYEETVSTEDDPDAPIISRPVLPGWYTVSFLSQDWYLEQLTPGGAERVEEAVLLSSRYLSTRVWDDSTSLVQFQFGAHGSVIDFRSGELQIGIRVETPGEAGAGGQPNIEEPVSGAGGSF